MLDMKLSGLLLLLLCCHGGSSVIHSLQYFSTASSGFSTFPEYVEVGMVDGLQIVYYDSNTRRVELKQVWMDQVTRDDPDYLERETGRSQSNQQVDKVSTEIAKQRFNQTGGAHINQWMAGCEWDDEDDEATGGYYQYGYDGEDFIALDLKTLTWIAPTPEALPTKRRWDHDTAGNQYYEHYLTKECVDWLKKYLAYGKSTLQRTERPQVSLLQRSPSSPVVCHATGFYPDRVMVFWTRDHQELYEHVVWGEVLPNHDGTFQVSADLDLSSVPAEDWGRYRCVVQLEGIEDIVTPLDPSLILSNWVKPEGTSYIIGAVGVLLAAVAAVVVGVVLYRKCKASSPQSPASSPHPPASTLQPLLSSPHPPPSTLQPPAPTLHPPASTLQPPAPTLQPPAPTLQPPLSSLQPPPSTLQPPAPTLQPPPSCLLPPLSTSSFQPPPSTLHSPASSPYSPASSPYSPASSP